jgi:hypothetical protein
MSGLPKLRSAFHCARALCLILVSMPVGALAYDPFQYGQAAGMYLAASDLHIRLSQSKCGYAFKRMPPTYAARVAEVMRSLRGADRVELEQFIRSPEFLGKLSRNQTLIDRSFDKYLSDGLDIKTACGLLVGGLAPVITEGEEAWRRVQK